MSTRKRLCWNSGSLATVLLLATGDVRSAENHADFGRPASPAVLQAWDIDVRADGAGLPEGSGTADIGRELFASRCAACHGPTGQEGPRDRLVGGQGTLASSRPIKTIGSYWPYAPTVFDYIRRAMPFTAPGTLQPDEVYSLVAYLLQQNGAIPEGAVMDKATLPRVAMPNRDGFEPISPFPKIKQP